jgi:hypothetical protein
MSASAEAEETLVPPPGPLGRPRWQIALLLTAIFVSGGLIGAGVAVLVNREPESLAPGPPETHREMYDRQMDRIAREVNLTEGQKPQVRKILVETYGPDRQNLMHGMRPKVQAMYDRLTRRMLEVLSEEQKPLWRKFVARRMDWWTTGVMKPRPSSKPATPPAK